MALERTLSIIKPNAMAKNVVGEIITAYEQGGLRVVACRMALLTLAECERFYEEHKERPFFEELTQFMSSASVLLSVWEGEGAVLKGREIMGATNPSEAAAGTLRAKFGDSVGKNAVHGSDSIASARREVELLFPNLGS